MFSFPSKIWKFQFSRGRGAETEGRREKIEHPSTYRLIDRSIKRSIIRCPSCRTDSNYTENIRSRYRSRRIDRDVEPSCPFAATAYVGARQTRTWTMRHSHLFLMESDHLRGVARDTDSDGGLLLCRWCLSLSAFGRRTWNWGKMLFRVVRMLSVAI